MAYELRMENAVPAKFQTEQEAVKAAQQAMRVDPDVEPEIIDLATGQPAMPGGSKAWREELKRKVGF